MALKSTVEQRILEEVHAFGDDGGGGNRGSGGGGGMGGTDSGPGGSSTMARPGVASIDSPRSVWLDDSDDDDGPLAVTHQPMSAARAQQALSVDLILRLFA